MNKFQQASKRQRKLFDSGKRSYYESAENIEALDTIVKSRKKSIQLAISKIQGLVR